MSSSTLRSRPRGGTVRFGTKEQFLESRVLHRASEEVSFVDTTIQCIGEGVSTPNCISVGGWCQGWRKEMEDEQVSVSGRQNNSGICVTVLFDGHRGSQAAQFVSKKLPQRIIRAVQSTPFTLAPRKKPKHKVVKRTEKEFQDRYKHIVQSFYEIDRELYKEQETHAKGIQLTDVLDPPFDFGDDFKCTSPKYPENRSRRSYSHSSYLEADFSKQRRLSTSGGFTIMGPEPDDDVVKLDEDIPIENGSVTEVAEIKVEVKMSEERVSSRRCSIKDSSGTTALAIIVESQTLTVAGLGDCEAYLVERRPDHPRTAQDDDRVSDFYGFPPTFRTLSDLVMIPTGLSITRICNVHRATNTLEVRRLLYLFGPSVFYRAAVAMEEIEPNFSDPSALDEAVRTTARNAKVQGVLSVTRSFGDFDLKYGNTPFLPSCPLKNKMEAIDAPLRIEQLGKIELGKEEFVSPLVVSNVPEVHVYQRGAIPPPPENEEEAISYDLLVVGCDGIWERQSVVHIAQRADDALQPLLKDTYMRENNSQVWWRQVEEALKEVIQVTLRHAIAPISKPNGNFLGGDNLSLNLTLLL